MLGKERMERCTNESRVNDGANRRPRAILWVIWYWVLMKNVRKGVSQKEHEESEWYTNDNGDQRIERLGKAETQTESITEVGKTMSGVRCGFQSETGIPRVVQKSVSEDI